MESLRTLNGYDTGVQISRTTKLIEWAIRILGVSGWLLMAA